MKAQNVLADDVDVAGPASFDGSFERGLVALLDQRGYVA